MRHEIIQVTVPAQTYGYPNGLMLLQRAGIECLDAARFVSGDIPILLHNPAKFVDAFEKAGFREAVDGKFDACAIGELEGLGCKIYRDFSIFRQGEEALVDVMRDDDRQERVLERVPAEYIREGGTDYCSEPELGERPGSVLARGFWLSYRAEYSG